MKLITSDYCDAEERKHRYDLIQIEHILIINDSTIFNFFFLYVRISFIDGVKRFEQPVKVQSRIQL